MIADTRSTSRAQIAPRHRDRPPAVRWEKIGAQLGAVLSQVTKWRARTGAAEVVGAGLARQIIARTLAAFWRCTGDAAGIPAAVEAACADLGDGASIGPGDVTRELEALLGAPRALARVADLRAAAPSWRWTYPGAGLARGSDELHAAGVNVLVSLGDFRAPPHVAAAWGARTGRTSELEAARLAGAVSVQWFGRARVVREGAAVLMLHVGELPSPDWHWHQVDVVKAAVGKRAADAAEDAPEAVQGAQQGAPRAEDGATPRPPAAAPTAAPKRPAVRPVADTPAARAVGAMLAAGWTAGDLARRLAATLRRAPDSVARTLRRWRDGGEPGDADLLGALVDLAREARDPTDALRARVVYLTRGRGNARVWAGAGSTRNGTFRGTPGLRLYADRFNVDVTLADLAAFAGGAARPAVVDLLLRDTGGGAPVVSILEAAHGIAPPAPLGAKSSAGERARAVAEGSVEGSEWTRGDALRLRPGVVRPAAPSTPSTGSAPRPDPAAAASGMAPPVRSKASTPSAPRAVTSSRPKGPPK